MPLYGLCHCLIACMAFYGLCHCLYAFVQYPMYELSHCLYAFVWIVSLSVCLCTDCLIACTPMYQLSHCLYAYVQIVSFPVCLCMNCLSTNWIAEFFYVALHCIGRELHLNPPSTNCLYAFVRIVSLPVCLCMDYLIACMPMYGLSHCLYAFFLLSHCLYAFVCLCTVPLYGAFVRIVSLPVCLCTDCLIACMPLYGLSHCLQSISLSVRLCTDCLIVSLPVCLCMDCLIAAYVRIVSLPVRLCTDCLIACMPMYELSLSQLDRRIQSAYNKTKYSLFQMVMCIPRPTVE